MKKLKRLWPALERIAGLLEIPASWEAHCGEDFPLVRPHLRLTETLGSRHPCPFPTSGDCPRKIVDYGDGEFAAICRDPHKRCEDLPLKVPEALLHELDLAGFLKPVLHAASIQAESPKQRAHGVWSVGLSNRRGSLNQPAYLLVFRSAQGFQAAVRDLLLDVPGQFIIVAPTNAHRGVELQERLQARGIGYLCLQDQILVDDRGRFSAVDPIESADKIPVTQIADRKRVVKDFTTKHHCKVAEIQRAAGVHETDYYDWLNGKDPDHYAHCIRIEQILHRGLPKPVPQKLS